MEKIIAALNEQYGVGNVRAAIFFHYVDGELKTITPMIEGCNSVGELVKRLYIYSDALKHMADDMVNRTLSKN